MATKKATPNKRKPPAYQEYAADVIANQDWRMMSFAERGLWDTLRKECWVSGKVPGKTEDLSRLLNKCTEEISAALTSRVLQFFQWDGNWLVCPELEDYRHSLSEKNHRMSEGGRKGGTITQQRIKTAQMGSQAPLEAPIKPLRGDESIREAGKRRETIPLNSEQQEWVKDYEQASDASELRYERHRA